MSTLPRIGRKVYNNNASTRIGDILGMKYQDQTDQRIGNQFTRASSQDQLFRENLQRNVKDQQYQQDQGDQEFERDLNQESVQVGQDRQYRDIQKIPQQYIRPQSNIIANSASFKNDLPTFNGPNSLSAKQFQNDSDNILSGANGRALLHDLDKKFDEQDRVIKYLMQQIQQQENFIQGNKSQLNQQFDKDLQNFSKLQNQMRQLTDQQNIQTQDLLIKVKNLEEQIQVSEQTGHMVRDKLRITEDNNREMINFIKGLQSQGDSELNSMRQFLQQKITEDQQNSLKINEKNTVLFNEMVRLGQENESYQERIQQIQQTFEQRIQILEGRLISTEQGTILADRKGETNQGILADIIDKMETKVFSMEQNVDILRNEFNRERDNLGRLELTNLRNNEDFKNAVGQIQIDFGSKLEIKMTELINRMLQEQEDRLRQVDEIKQQIEMKDKINNQQVRYERDEMRDRYQAMDSVVKAEFQRKDEAIMGLQQSIDTQLRTINGWIKQEELSRSQQEINLRSEIMKAQDNIKYDIDTFKNNQVQVTEKLSEIIKMEVDSRMQTDKETKSLIAGLIKNVMGEVGTIREQSELTIQKLVKDVKEAAQDSAERAHFLSRYIDEEVLKIGQKVNGQVEAIKVLCTSITDQFKKHLINHENMKRDIYARFEIIENHMPTYRSELFGIISTNEKRSSDQLQEVRKQLEDNVQYNFNVLDERVDKFCDLMDSSLESLRQAIADNRDVYVSVINRSNIEQEERINFLVQDVEKIVAEMYEIQLKLQNSGQNNGEETGNFKKQLQDLEAHINTVIITERAVRKAMGKNLTEDIGKVQNIIQNLNTSQKEPLTSQKIQDNIQSLNQNSQINEEVRVLKDQVKTLKVEIQDNKELIDQAIKLANDPNKVKEIESQIQDINKKLNEKQIQNPKEAKDDQKFVTMENVDAKIQSNFEKLKKENQYLWKNTVQVAQQQFNEKGIDQFINLMPLSLQGVEQLKTTILSLDNSYADDRKNGSLNGDLNANKPKPSINQNIIKK